MAFFVSSKLKEETVLPQRRIIEELCVPPASGLSSQQVRERMENGYSNLPIDPPSKTVGQIVRANLLTYFNLVFFTLAALVISVGSWLNLTFAPVVLSNIIIGIVQELKSKRTLDKLSIITSPKAIVIRDGSRKTINTTDTVRDDIVIFSTGSQIFADAIVADGECQVNESLMTGEADEIRKVTGDELMSGSFIVSGSVAARLTRVGKDSYVSQLTLESKKSKRQKQSEMMRSLSILVKWIGIILIPMGILLILNETLRLDQPFEDGILSTVGALVGMIPEGLYLLTSVALAAAVVRLAMNKTIVHDMSSIETLARVDTLCVDKTGTITESKMIMEDICLLCEDRFVDEDIRMIMSDYMYAMQDDNDTMAALRKYFKGEKRQTAIETLPFTSVKKYGGISFHEEETYILGAPDVILADRYGEYKEQIDFYSQKGCRVLLLALYDGKLSDTSLSAGIMPLALLLLANKIRKNAVETFSFFASQGVEIKVISGDNALSVSEVAKRAGIANAEKFIDARTLDDDIKIEHAAMEYTVFGRVAPEQKRKIIRALKKAGRTVAMTGDGVNDVLALKEADCSVAMASGSDVACQVSHVVLLNSNFASMPSVVMEGRRVINNIECTASLFLVRNIFAFFMALISLIFALHYPLVPAQVSLVGVLTIGIPSFILAMEPNQNIVKGKFLRNAIYRALPGVLTNIILVLGVMLFWIAFDFPKDEMSTIAAIIMGVVGLGVLYHTCQPFNLLRKILLITMASAFLIALIFFYEIFLLVPLTFESYLVLAVFVLLAYPLMYVLTRLLENLEQRYLHWSKGRRHSTV